MCLLDTLLEVGDEHLHAEVTPRRDDLFAGSEGIPGWVGLEWLAQAIAAWAGVQAVSQGDEPRIGFLLGTRRYCCESPWFAFDQPIRVEVALDFRADNGLGAFRGELRGSHGESLATATLNVFQPESLEALKAMQREEHP
ncbi:hypothetical protein Q427_33980 [Halomonas sp. BC04]|nr:hypothetical protein Q427_33980 [Halomonas sp. BC04]